MRQTIIGSTGAVFVGGALLFLTACGGGGGGGGGGVAYGGKTEKAVVRQDNAQDLVDAAVAGAELGEDLGGLGGGIAFRGAVPSGTTSPSASPLGLGRLVTQLLDESLAPSGRAYRRVAVDESMAGSCGGSARIRGSGDDETGAFQGTFSFQNFCEEDAHISGSIAMVGQINPDTGEFGQLRLTISHLTIEDGLDDVSMGGTLDFTFQGSNMTASMNLTVRDNNAGEAIRLENYAVTSTEVAQGERITLAGRVYHSSHGHVDVTTPTAFLIAFGHDNPSSGVLRADGTNNTWARLTAVSATHYQLEGDTDGDGSADWTSDLLPWDDL